MVWHKLGCWEKISAGDILKHFFFLIFPRKGFGMKCQSLFFEKKKKNNNKNNNKKEEIRISSENGKG